MDSFYHQRALKSYKHWILI